MVRCLQEFFFKLCEIGFTDSKNEGLFKVLLHGQRDPNAPRHSKSGSIRHQTLLAPTAANGTSLHLLLITSSNSIQQIEIQYHLNRINAYFLHKASQNLDSHKFLDNLTNFFVHYLNLKRIDLKVPGESALLLMNTFSIMLLIRQKSFWLRIALQ